MALSSRPPSDPERADKFWTGVLMSHPPRDLVDAPEFPPRPDEFQEIDWAPYVGSKDAKLARILWDRPTRKLRQHLDSLDRHPFPRPDEDDDTRAMKHTEVLAFEVYEHLLLEHMYPIAESEWQAKWTQMGMDQAKWRFDDILNDWGHMNTDTPVLIRGWDVLSSRKLNVAILKEELRDRNLDQTGKSQVLRQRLYDYEQREQKSLTLFSRSDLSHWKISEGEPRKRKMYPGDELDPLDMYTWAIKVSPYNPTYWVSRAYCYYQQAFFDLAIGDAYRAQLLCEVLVDARCRNRYPGLYPRIWHAISQHILAGMDDTGYVPREVEKMRQPNGINYFIPTLRKALHNIISLSLAALQAKEDHKAMEKYLTQRVIMPDRDTRPFERRGEVMEAHFEQTHDEKEAKKRWFHESRAGKVSAQRLYPYESSDKHRTDQDFLDELNQRLFGNNQALPWKRCEVKSVDRLKPAKDSATELGVFATEDIKKGQMIFVEEPAMRGHLNVSRLPKDRCEYSARTPRCDNCYKQLDPATPVEDQERIRKIKAGEDNAACKCALLDEEEAIPLSFCPPGSGPKTCSEIARKLYHFRACGKNWKWLHDAMRPYIMPVRNHRNHYYFSHTNETHGTLLSLLLREVFDITLERRERLQDPNLMAHEIDELLILENSSDWPDEKVAFPFTLAANIQVPFDILMQLGVDIFGDLSFDTWVIQIVLRKLLINAVPWADKEPAKKIVRQKKIHDGEKQDEMIKRGESFESYDPSFRALYLYPGLSLFNHACPEKHNAQWGFDLADVPNRVFVWAKDDIPKGEEILIPYTELPLTKAGMLRQLGRQCACDGEHVDESSVEDDSPEQSPRYPGLSAAPRDPTPYNSSDPGQSTPPRSLGTQTKTIGAQMDGADDDREEFVSREQHSLPEATEDEFDWELEHHMATRKRPYRAEWQASGNYKRRHFAS